MATSAVFNAPGTIWPQHPDGPQWSARCERLVAMQKEATVAGRPLDLQLAQKLILDSLLLQSLAHDGLS